MLQIHYGLNQPFNSAYTPAREAVDSTVNYVTGQWVKLTGGKVELATMAAQAPGAEVVFEPNNKNWSGTVPTISGLFEGSTDQFVAGGIADGNFLTIGAGGQLVDDGAAITANSIAIAMGLPTGGVLRFKKIR